MNRTEKLLIVIQQCKNRTMTFFINNQQKILNCSNILNLKFSGAEVTKVSSFNLNTQFGNQSFLNTNKNNDKHFLSF
jgi:hypothetical protein